MSNARVTIGLLTLVGCGVTIVAGASAGCTGGAAGDDVRSSDSSADTTPQFVVDLQNVNIRTDCRCSWQYGTCRTYPAASVTGAPLDCDGGAGAHAEDAASRDPECLPKCPKTVHCVIFTRELPGVGRREEFSPELCVEGDECLDIICPAGTHCDIYRDDSAKNNARCVDD